MTFFALLLGCPDLTPVDSFARSEDAADDSNDDDDDDSNGDDDDSALGPALETLGSVSLACWEFPDADGHATSGCQFGASFWALIERGEPGSGGVSYVSPSGADTCAVTLFSEADTAAEGGSPDLTAALSAGTLSLGSVLWDVDLEPVDRRDGELGYYLDLEPELEVPLGGSFDLAASGAQFPGFEAPAALFLPAAIQLLSPPTGGLFELQAGDLEITWAGGSEDRLWLEFFNETLLVAGNAQITCDVVNDGSFVLPSELLDQLPDGDSLRLILSQTWSGELEVDGLGVGLGSSTSVQARAQAP